MSILDTPVDTPTGAVVYSQVTNETHAKQNQEKNTANRVLFSLVFFLFWYVLVLFSISFIGRFTLLFLFPSFSSFSFLEIFPELVFPGAVPWERLTRRY